MDNDREYFPDDPEIIYYPQEPEEEPGWSDPLVETKPHARYDPLAETRYHDVVAPEIRRRRRRPGFCCCLPVVGLAGLLGLLLVYLFFPFRTNILLLGLDSRPGQASLGRSDTMILTTFLPYRPYVGMLSIPRDLWVNVPGVGENRINTAHFFAEAEAPGRGPAAAMNTVSSNFGVDVHYFVRIRFSDFESVVDAMGGVEVDLPRSMAGYPAGTHHLSGSQALALVRDREGTDDFFRMVQGQIFLKSLARQLARPNTWLRSPEIIRAVIESTETDVPVWLWPRLAVIVLLTGPDEIDARNLTRDMITPFTTSGGAQVLLPRWDQINPVLMEMFGQ
jgi:polyisoprenyl-teichoic acid--peptidoglycan teichoic acid transferase